MSPRDGEAVRWQCVDGRWVTIGLGHGEHMGEAMVQRWDGETQYVESYEAALELAKQWRKA